MKAVKSEGFIAAFVIFCIFIFEFIGCSLTGPDKGTISLYIDENTVNQIISYAGGSLFNNDNLFIDIFVDSPFQDYQAEESMPFKNKMNITFDEIPADSMVSVSASVYFYQKNADGTLSKTELYSGKSELIKIHDGMNYLNLPLTKNSFVFVELSVKAFDDFELSYKKDGSKLIFTAEGTSAMNYSWYVDGQLQKEKSAIFILETEGLQSGSYELEVRCGFLSAAAFISIQ